jgi:hypothetical protein
MATTEMSKDEEAAFAAMQAAEMTAGQAEPEAGEPETERPEAEEAEAESGGGARPPAKMVPHAALHEERTRRQGLEAENRRLVEERALFEGRLQAVVGMQRDPRLRGDEPRAAEPDENTDPIATIGHLRRRLAAIEAGGAQLGEQARDQARMNRLTAAATADAREFRTKTPDYDQAYNFFLSNRDAELAFYGVPQAERAQIIDNEQLQIAAGAFQRGISPAQVLYDVARHRGYKPSAAGAGEKIERIASGQERGKTLSGTGGGAAGPEMTAERLLKMSNEEFDAWTSRNPAKARRLMGG